MRRAALLALLSWAAACESPKPETGGAEPSAKPIAVRASVSDQRGVKRGGASQILPGVPGETDGREVDAGAGFRDEATKGCADIKCVGDNCARLCAKWTNENPPSAAAGDIRNKVYLGCLGTCLTEVDQ